MDYLKRQEIISTPECKGMPMRLSEKPVAIHAQDLPLRPDCHLSAGRIAPLGLSEPEHEFRRRKGEALYVAPATRRTRNQQADDVQPSEPATNLHPLQTPAELTGRIAASWAPPEACLATGPEQLLMAANSTCAVFDKTGQQLLLADLRDWFAPVARQVEIFSPKVLFDAQRGCWVLAACARPKDNSRLAPAMLLLAVSQSSDPLSNWWIWSLDVSLNGSVRTTNWADGLGLAVDQRSLYLTVNQFDEAGKFAYSKIRILAKREVYAGSNLHGWDYWDLRNPDGSPVFGLQPAHNGSATEVQYFANANQSGKGVTTWAVSNAARNAPQVRRRFVATKEYRLAPNALLPGKANRLQEVETGDVRLTNVVFRNGLLWLAHTVSTNWGGDTNVAAIQWFQINPLTGSTMQQGLYGAPHLHYYSPVVMVDRQGHLLLVFHCAGAQAMPSIRFTGRRASDKSNTLQASALLKQSPVPGGKVWSACSGASLDPGGGDFWMMGQYATAQHQWATWLGQTSYAPQAASNFRSPSVRSRSKRKAIYA